MVIPLLILAGFALLLGYAGVNEEFPIIGPILGNPLHHFLGEFAETLEIHAEAIPFDPVPVVISILAVFGGLGLSYLVYGRAGKGWQTYDQLDPLEAGMQRIGLGGVYNASRNKFYFDELYNATFVLFALVLAVLRPGSTALSSTAWLTRWCLRPLAGGYSGPVLLLGNRRHCQRHWFAGSLGRRRPAAGADRPGAKLSLGCSPDERSWLLALFFIQVVGIGIAG